MKETVIIEAVQCSSEAVKETASEAVSATVSETISETASGARQWSEAMRHLIIKSIVLIRCSVLIDKSTTRCSVLIHYPLQCAEGTVHEPLAKQAEAAARDEFLATERTSTPLAARVPDSTFASLRVCLIAPLPDCTFA